MCIPWDKQDKLHGCLEHRFNQVILSLGRSLGLCSPLVVVWAGLVQGCTQWDFCLQVDTIKVLLK